MYFGYLSFQSFTFLAAGFWVVMVSGIGLILVYAVGTYRGRASGPALDQRLRVVAGGRTRRRRRLRGGDQAVAGVHARVRGRTLVEMGVLALLFVGSMWFMALRYTQGLEK